MWKHNFADYEFSPPPSPRIGRFHSSPPRSVWSPNLFYENYCVLKNQAPPELWGRMKAGISLGNTPFCSKHQPTAKYFKDVFHRHNALPPPKTQSIYNFNSQAWVISCQMISANTKKILSPISSTKINNHFPVMEMHQCKHTYPFCLFSWLECALVFFTIDASLQLRDESLHEGPWTIHSLRQRGRSFPQQVTLLFKATSTANVDSCGAAKMITLWYKEKGRRNIVSW